MVDYRQIITIEPGKRGGKPCVRGLRITVYDVLGYLAAGMSYDEVLADFPDLTRDDILACLAFAADNRTLVSASADKTARISDVGVVTVLEAHAGGVAGIAFHNTGNRILA